MGRTCVGEGERCEKGEAETKRYIWTATSIPYAKCASWCWRRRKQKSREQRSEAEPGTSNIFFRQDKIKMCESLHSEVFWHL